jgi:acetyl-CoA decarbonylase/synthase complex subunit gamma
MALTGLEIYKRLPKQNCKECGLPTCLAFAMKVAAGQAGLDACPRLSPEARAELSEASAPPQRLVKIGPESAAIEVGQETVLFRHDERFHHPTAVALTVSDAQDAAALMAKAKAFGELQFPRVGQVLHPDMIALVNESGASERFAAAAETLHKALGVPLALMSAQPAALAAAAAVLAGARPVLYCTDEAVPVEALADLGRQTGAPLCVAGPVERVAERAEALAAKGVRDLLLSPGPAPAAETLSFLTRTRRAALQKKFRPLGYPVLAVSTGADPIAAAVDAAAYVCKYAAVVVCSAWEPYLLLPILTTRQNIFTDPQKPVQVEAKVYEIGEVRPESPVLVTTNFSLSYYSVEAEVEASRIPCRILAVDTEGTSVLTAWAADKFNPATITAAIRKAGLDERVSHKKLVLPGLVAVLAASVADESGWKVLVGPKEASGIAPYLKSDWKVA